MTCSVIVTAFNQSNTIAQTLDSILLQNCNFPFEIIIGDDHSTDGTQEICLEYQKRFPNIIRTIFHETNVGVAANFVLCIRKSKGKYIAVCAADDFWHDELKLQIEVDFLENNREYGLVYTDYNRLNVNTNKTIKNWFKFSGIPTLQGENLIKSFFAGKVPALTLTVMFRKDLYDKYVPADDYIKYNFPIEDWPTWLILSKYSNIGYLPESTATYRYGHESLSNQKSYKEIEQKYTNDKIMYKYLCKLFPDDLPFDEKGYDSYVYSVLLSFAFKQKDYSKAKEFGKKIHGKTLKVFCSQNRILFWGFILAKRIKNSLI
jgi:glycosyltransferase involved in cell wall biosynthesis